jgi:hypothetical protein
VTPTRWTESADKHHVDRADTLHAMKNAQLRLTRFDPPRVEGAPWADLFIGPSRDGTAMLEVFAHLNLRAQDVLIFHVMPLRRSTLERAREIIEERRNPT